MWYSPQSQTVTQILNQRGKLHQVMLRIRIEPPFKIKMWLDDLPHRLCCYYYYMCSHWSRLQTEYATDPEITIAEDWVGLWCAAVMTVPLLHLWVLWKEYSCVTFSCDLTGGFSALPDDTHVISLSVSHKYSDAHQHSPSSSLFSTSLYYFLVLSAFSLLVVDSLCFTFMLLFFSFFFCSCPLIYALYHKLLNLKPRRRILK